MLILKYIPFAPFLFSTFCQIRKGLILRKLVMNGDIQNFPYGRRGVRSKIINQWITTAKSEIVKTELKKALFWGRLNTISVLLFIVLVALAIICH